MTREWSIAGLTALRGERTVKRLDVARMADGTTLGVAVHVIAGGSCGPTLCLLGTEHGDETLGIDVIRRVVSEIDPRELSGQLVAIPVVNPLSFAAQTYHTPQDMKNVHASYPGTIEGSLTDKLASVVASSVLSNVSAIINLHGAGRHLVNSFTYVPELEGELGERALDLARTFGQRILFRGPVGPGYAVSYAARTSGTPGIIVELGSDLTWPPEEKPFVDVGVRGVLNVLSAMGMIRATGSPPDWQILVKERRTLRARHGGMFYPRYGQGLLGQTLPKGETLGVVVDPHTLEEVDELRVPYREGLVFMVRGRGRVHAGDYMFHIGDMESAQRLT